MKKVLSLVAAMFAMGAVMAQTIVSTQPQNRNVILEEFTGYNCQYCPDGHKKANEICADHEGRAWAINIHTGGYATGSGYETDYGAAIASQSNLSGYPMGTINRHLFSGNATAMSRGDWANAANTILAMESPVNIAAEGSINVDTRVMTLHIEIYYTANSNNATNLLNIALLQNNVFGPQVGASTWYPEMVVNGEYRHMHMLRDMLTGQWGVEIPATQGTFIDTTITYTIPQSIGSVPINNIADIDVVAFVAEGHQEILTGTKANIVLNKPVLAGVYAETSDCSLEYNLYAVVFNCTTDPIHNITLSYEGNTISSNNTVPSLAYDTIMLPSYTISVSGEAVQQCNTTKSVTFTGFDNLAGATIAMNMSASVNFADFNIYTAAGPFTARIGVDAYRSEAGVSLINQSNCQALWTESNFGSDVSYSAQYVSQIPNAGYYNITFNPAEAGLYILRALDSYGDGWTWTNNTNVSGIWISNASGEVASYPWGYSDGINFSQFDIYLNVTSTGDGSHTVGINDVAEVNFSVYPNPASDRLNISCNEAVREVSVIDMAGRTVINVGSESTLNVSGLAAGVYVVRVATESGIGMQKFVKE